MQPVSFSTEAAALQGSRKPGMPDPSTQAQASAVAAERLAFVIAGAQKSGTSTLDALLRAHPGIDMARIKETHFFDDESTDWSSPDYGRLHAYFAPNRGRLRGESTPITLYWTPALERLHAYNPRIRLILMLRNPVTRAFSNWKKEYSKGLETLDFASAIRKGTRRVADEAETRGLHRVFSYVQRGFYGAQLDSLLTHFPREQVHCEIFEDFVADQFAGMARICSFLGVSPPEPSPFTVHRNPGRTFAYPSALEETDRAHLADLYRADVAHLRKLLGCKLETWTDFPA